MRTILKFYILFSLISGFCYSNSDSIPKRSNLFINGAIQLNSYFSNSILFSKEPISYSFGIGITKQFEKHTFLSSSINYCPINYPNMDHSVIDPYKNTTVNILASIKFNRLGFENDLIYRHKKTIIGLKAGLGIYLKGSIKEDITVEDTSSNAINFYNKYIIYTQQEKSLFRLIVPHAGATFGYCINEYLTLKYDFCIDVFSQPYNKFEFLKPFNPILQKLSLTFNIKKK
jgi:hypothetical protein